MSSEDIADDPINIIMRRERRITIKMHKLRRQQSVNSGKAREMIEHKSVAPHYEAGDDVSGLVGLEVNGGQAVVKIILRLICFSQVHCQSYRTKRKSVINLITGDDREGAKENQIYFDRKVITEIDLGKSSDLAKWPNGKYEFPFRLTLPEEGLASTMNSCHGFIRYTVEVFTMDEDQNESRGEKEIVVIAPIQEKLDLHGRSLEKSMHILGSGKITINGALERKEYIPGDVIPVEVIVINDSNIDVEPRVSLFQQQLFVCNQVHRTMETCLSREPYTASPVPGNTSATHIIKVPLATNLVVSLRSPLITVRYFVHVTIDIPHSADLNLNLPFVVTTRRARACANLVQGHQQHLTHHPANGNGQADIGSRYHSVACQQQTHPNVNIIKNRK